MVSTSFFQAQAEKKNQELVKKLHGETPQYFLERAICGINDSLTSILGVCDMEAKGAVPKIKRYIERINQALGSIKAYQSAVHEKGAFNLSVILENVLNVTEENCGDKIKFTRLISELKGKAKGNALPLEEFLFYLFVQMAAQDPAGQGSDVLVELRQKNDEAMITILKDRFRFSEDSLEELKERTKRVNGTVQISAPGTGVEIIVRLPLVFELPKLTSSRQVTFGPPVTKL